MQLDKLKLLEDIRQAAEAIQRYTHEKLLEDYLTDDQLQASVERKFEIIGEALNRIKNTDDMILEKISEHHRIIGFRNILIHGYDIVDEAIVWKAITIHLPILVDEIKEILND